MRVTTEIPINRYQFPWLVDYARDLLGIDNRDGRACIRALCKYLLATAFERIKGRGHTEAPDTVVQVSYPVEVGKEDLGLVQEYARLLGYGTGTQALARLFKEKGLQAFEQARTLEQAIGELTSFKPLDPAKLATRNGIHQGGECNGK